MPDKPTSLSLQSPEPSQPARGRPGLVVLLVLLLALLLAGLGFFGREALRRADAVERQLASVSAKTDEAAALSRQAIERAAAAEASAAVAAAGRQLAETGQQAAEAETALAREETGTARRQAASALEAAAQAQVEADRIRKQAEAEVNRLEQALGQVAETRRTALGLVMNLGSDYLKFEFDKAELRPEDRELLARIAGILMTSQDYSVSVNGHTDDVGTEEYNQKLSERRAEAVRDYLVKAGLPPSILSVTGHGKSRPLVPGSSEQARAKNRRVELGIAHMRILQGKPGAPKASSPPGS
jgi:outer membrane protein OmpA-like peptidoglycan-associated protein